MTRLQANLGAAQSDTWAELYAELPGTTWQNTEPTRRTPALAMTAVVIGLSMSSPCDYPVLRQAELFPQSSSVNPNNSAMTKSPALPLRSTGEQLAAVQSALGLNKSQLAAVCRVKRQTIYDWYAGNFEAEGSNAQRLAKLYRVATLLRRAGVQPLPMRVVEKQLPSGNSLLALLCEDDVDPTQIRGAVLQLQLVPGATVKESARAQRERLGWAPLSEEQRQAQLEVNLDSLRDG